MFEQQTISGDLDGLYRVNVSREAKERSGLEGRPPFSLRHEPVCLRAAVIPFSLGRLNEKRLR